MQISNKPLTEIQATPRMLECAEPRGPRFLPQDNRPAGSLPDSLVFLTSSTIRVFLIELAVANALISEVFGVLLPPHVLLLFPSGLVTMIVFLARRMLVLLGGALLGGILLILM